MGIEKHNPSPEEIELAEEIMTTEQKIQSEAHEEGYNLGKERGRIIYTGPVLSVDKTTNPNIATEHKISLDKFAVRGNEFVLELNRLCLENGVNCDIKESGNSNDKKVNISLVGKNEDVLRVVQGLQRRF